MTKIFDFGWMDIPQCNTYSGWSVWSNLMRRLAKGKGRYKEVTIDPSWMYFSKFQKWYEEHPQPRGWQLDKDLLSNGLHDHYGPERCVWLPKEINQAIQRHKGVEKKGKGWIACMRRGGKAVYGGVKDSIEEAREEYVEMKREELRFLADYYKPMLSREVYEKLLEYDFS